MAIAFGAVPRKARSDLIPGLGPPAHRPSRTEHSAEEHIAGALETTQLFSEHEDLHRFGPSVQIYRNNASKQWATNLHQLPVMLFHRSQVATQPRKLMPSWKPNDGVAAAQKRLAARKLTDTPSPVDKLELAARVFGNQLSENHPEITTFADVTRDHRLG